MILEWQSEFCKGGEENQHNVFQTIDSWPQHKEHSHEVQKQALCSSSTRLIL